MLGVLKVSGTQLSSSELTRAERKEQRINVHSRCQTLAASVNKKDETDSRWGAHSRFNFQRSLVDVAGLAGAIGPVGLVGVVGLAVVVGLAGLVGLG